MQAGRLRMYHGENTEKDRLRERNYTKLHCRLVAYECIMERRMDGAPWNTETIYYRCCYSEIFLIKNIFSLTTPNIEHSVMQPC